MAATARTDHGDGLVHRPRRFARDVLLRVKTEYTGNLPLYISENGASFRDYVNPEGKCHDPERVDFLQAIICARRTGRVSEGRAAGGLFRVVAAG